MLFRSPDLQSFFYLFILFLFILLDSNVLKHIVYLLLHIIQIIRQRKANHYRSVGYLLLFVIYRKHKDVIILLALFQYHYIMPLLPGNQRFAFYFYLDLVLIRIRSRGVGFLIQFPFQFSRAHAPHKLKKVNYFKSKKVSSVHIVYFIYFFLKKDIIFMA